MSDIDPHSTARRRWALIVGIVAAAIVIVAAGWFILVPGKPAPTATAAAMPAPAVGVRPVATRPVSRAFEFVGRIKAVNIVEVRARIEGFLDRVLFTEGQDVKTGDLLYQIEKVQFQSALDQAKGNLLVADATVVNAKLEYDRQLNLVQRQYTPQSVLDKDKADLDAASGRKMQAEAAVTQAQANLDYTDIRSPIDGR
ncbi:MAG TPA: efflux RND transporter periplasmic adaptor subunit, partial [Reyranella sp.]